MTVEVHVRSMRPDERDLELFRESFAKNSPRPRSSESLRWQYLANTADRVFVDLALADDEKKVAAIYATLPGFMRIGGERRLIVQSLDTLTDADFRGKGLFVSLAKRTFERAGKDGCALVYGFPNGNSAHGFFKKLGWTSLDPVPFLVRPLRTKYFTEKLPKRIAPFASALPDLPLAFRQPRSPRGYRVQELEAFDERVTELWRAFASGIDVALDRDAAYLRWRIGEKPEEAYRTLALEKDGRLDALCIFAVKDKHGGRIGYVLDVLFRPGAASAGRRLLATAVAQMAAAKADAVLAWCFAHSPNYFAHLANGFFPLPEKLRPIELHLGVRAFDPAIAARVERREAWYVSYLDSDTV